MSGISTAPVNCPYVMNIEELQQTEAEVYPLQISQLNSKNDRGILCSKSNMICDGMKIEHFDKCLTCNLIFQIELTHMGLYARSVAVQPKAFFSCCPPVVEVLTLLPFCRNICAVLVIP